MFKVSAVPPRRSAVLTVFRRATAINEGTTAEPPRAWRCHCVLCRSNTALAPRLRCHGGRRSAILTIVRGATGNNSTAAKGYDCAFCDKSTKIGTLVVLYI